jgi:uncharacterized Rmd1/YagE family protein
LSASPAGPQPLPPAAKEYVIVAFHIVAKIPIPRALELVAGLGLPDPPDIDPGATDVLVELPYPDAWCGFYDFGSVAFFNAPAEQRERVLEAVRASFEALEGESTTDDFRVIVDPQGQERVSFNHAVLTDLARTKIEILALVVAQSTTLEYYEKRVEELLDGAEAVSEPMKKHGRLPRYTRNTIRFIGISLATRRDLVSRMYILDEPESTWEDVGLDRLFKAMKTTLDIDVRYRALEYKLGLIREGVDVIVELTNAQRNIWLETIIVVLIVVEILLAMGMFK